VTAPLVLSGPDGDLPPGYARFVAGGSLLRRHRPGHDPAWFGPPVGTLGENRFDPPHARRPDEPGVCYLAEQLGGVLHEGVLRGVRWPAFSRQTLSTHHAVSEAIIQRDLVLIDLVHEPGIHGVQLADIAQRPQVAAKLTSPVGLVYPVTQTLAGEWLSRNARRDFPVDGGRVDGVLYVSRFAPVQRCVALWDHAANALIWNASVPLGRHPALETTLAAMGISLLD
jgi:hypothetical protein